MQVAEEFDYRNAKSILECVDHVTFDEFTATLNDDSLRLRLGAPAGRQQDLSKQLQKIFEDRGWEKEKSLFSLPELRYDLFKGHIPVEIEIGHERLVYADFFKFLADYSAMKIPAGIIVAAASPRDGHT